MATQSLRPTLPVAAAFPDRLDSWSEIAAYLRCGKRTVQRWESEEGLPVHRLRRNSLAAVYALRSELDAWWQARVERPAPLVPPAAAEPTVAVLPFMDLSPDKDQDYFCDGLAEEITGALSRSGGLRVASRLAAFRFKSAAADISALGRELHARNLVEGSVRIAGAQMRVCVRLVDAENGRQRWSATYDCTPVDVFAVQQDIAAGVVDGVRTALAPVC